MIYIFGVICFAPSRPEISVHWVPPIEATPTDATIPRGLQTETVIVQPRGPRPDPAAPCPSTEQQCRLTGRDHRDSKCGPRPSSCVSPPPQIAGHGKDERGEQSERFACHPTHRVYSTTQTNGKLERFHKTVKSECIRPKTPLSLDDARRLVGDYVIHYNNVRLHSAIGYVTPADKLAGREKEIFEKRDRKLAEAREARGKRREATYATTAASVVAPATVTP